ncbi:MAG: hypothetical protein O7E52_11420 [Candidatus Poribacteria bacterium]|nr:hypothetical protein [Candidatus Poribacteria bacterium]
MKTIQIPLDLLSQYAALTKNEILLYLAIQGLATAGKMKRNLLQVSRRLGKTEQRLRDAEFGLKKRGLLPIHWVGNQRWWSAHAEPHPDGLNPSDSTPARFISVVTNGL